MYSVISDTATETTNHDRIENLICLIAEPDKGLPVSYPVKLDVVIAVMCSNGTMKGNLNLKPFTAKAPCLLIVLSGQILQIDYFSRNYSGMALILSKKFWDGFSLDNALSFNLFRTISNKPWITLSPEEYESTDEYFRLLQKTIRNRKNANREEAVKHLTLAFFYGFGYQFHNLSDNSKKTKRDLLVERFLRIVQDNFRMHRDVGYYAGKMFLSSKYLSRAIKQASSKSAAEWIEEHVILESKALLKSTNFTVQQISDELNFPSQSFFGKYFKRRTGLSPRNYRNKSEFLNK